MAIGPSGGSAATRFRPRGTAPVGGLGRRNLLDTSGDDQVETPEAQNEAQETAPSAPQPNTSRRALGSALRQRPALPSQTKPTEASESESTPLEVQSDVTEGDVDEMPETSTAPQPSPQTPTSTRGRGRPRKPTRAVATPNSDNASPIAVSVSGARARMREIEQEAKQLRSQFDAELSAIKDDHERRMAPLRTEFEELSQTITAITFGG